MKNIDTSKFEQAICGDLLKKEAAINEKINKLQQELDKSRSELAEEEMLLEASKDDITAYKKHNRAVHDIKSDIEAVENLIAIRKKELQALDTQAKHDWEANCKSCYEQIRRLVTEYKKEKTYLLDIFLQIIKARATLIDIRSDLASRYKLDDSNLERVEHYDDITNPDAFKFFANEMMEIGGDKFDQLQFYGEIRYKD